MTPPPPTADRRRPPAGSFPFSQPFPGRAARSPHRLSPASHVARPASRHAAASVRVPAARPPAGDGAGGGDRPAGGADADGLPVPDADAPGGAERHPLRGRRQDGRGRPERAVQRGPGAADRRPRRQPPGERPVRLLQDDDGGDVRGGPRAVRRDRREHRLGRDGQPSRPGPEPGRHGGGDPGGPGGPAADVRAGQPAGGDRDRRRADRPAGLPGEPPPAGRQRAARPGRGPHLPGPQQPVPQLRLGRAGDGGADGDPVLAPPPDAAEPDSAGGFSSGPERPGGLARRRGGRHDPDPAVVHRTGDAAVRVAAALGAAGDRHGPGGPLQLHPAAGEPAVFPAVHLRGAPGPPAQRRRQRRRAGRPDRPGLRRPVRLPRGPRAVHAGRRERPGPHRRQLRLQPRSGIHLRRGPGQRRRPGRDLPGPRLPRPAGRRRGRAVRADVGVQGRGYGRAVQPERPRQQLRLLRGRERRQRRRLAQPDGAELRRRGDGLPDDLPQRPRADAGRGEPAVRTERGQHDRAHGRGAAKDGGRNLHGVSAISTTTSCLGTAPRNRAAT